MLHNQRKPSVAIIGLGYRGLSVLERLTKIAESANSESFEIFLFDSNPCGHGVHTMTQPEYFRLNTICGQLNLYPNADTLPNVPVSELRDGQDFLSFCRYMNLSTSDLLDSESVGEVVAGDFLPRRFMSLYLGAFFKELQRSCPSMIDLHVKYTRVQKVTPAICSKSRYTIIDDSRFTVDVDALVLCTGHGHYDASKAMPYLLPDEVLRIPKHNSVLVKGLGLSSVDSVYSLTLGNDGMFRELKSGDVKYCVSGKEPKIYMFSPTGLPFLTRPHGLDLHRPHRAVYMTSRRIHAMRHHARGGSLNFEQHILPLMLLEMRVAWCRATLKATAVSLDQFEHDIAVADGKDWLEDPLGMHLAHTETALSFYVDKLGHFDPHALLRKSLSATVPPEKYASWFTQQLSRDLLESSVGLPFSGTKAAGEVWRDLRGVLRDVINFGGLTKESTMLFYQEWVPVLNRLVTGPEPRCHRDIIALIRSGVVTVLHPAEARKRMAKNEFKHIVNGYTAKHRPRDTRSTVLHSLWSAGLLSESCVGGVDVGKDSKVIDCNGEPLPNIWCLGHPVEGSSYYNHYIPSPDAPSPAIMDAHNVARDCLEWMRVLHA